MVGCIGQGLNLWHGVHFRHALAIHHVIEQMQRIAVRRGATDAGNTNGGVLCACERGWRVAGVAVGAEQDGVVGFDYGLHFRRGIGQSAGDKGAVQGAVDGAHIGSCYTGNAGSCIQARWQRAGACIVGIGRCGNRAERIGNGCDGIVGHRLQLRPGINGAIRGGGLYCRLDGSQVGGNNAGNAQRYQIGQADHPSLRHCAACCCDDACGRFGQGLNFAFGVHCCLVAGVHNIIQ